MTGTKLILDRRRQLDDGTYPVTVKVGFSANIMIKTGVHIAPEDWDEASRIYTGKGAKKINDILQTKLAAVTMRVLDLRQSGVFRDLGGKNLRLMIENPDMEQPPTTAENTIEDMFNTVISVKGKRTGELYASTLARLRQYIDTTAVTFDDIDKLWLDRFCQSMADLKENTRGIHLRNLRAVNNYAIDCGVTQNYPFRRYVMPRQTARKRALSVEVIRRIAAVDAGRYNVYRDVFTLTFCLIGINFEDLCHLEDIKDGRINYVRAKTHKPYSIKIEPEAAALIETMKGEKQLLYMLDNHVDSRSYYRQLRRGLDAVRKAYNAAWPDEPLDELTTYFARHSWATIAASLDVPKDTISAALGHELGSRTTAIYIDFDLRKVDEANRKVLDWVFHNRR